MTWDSSINAREIYASTDSGIYILSPRVNAGQWTRSIHLKSYGIVSLNPSNSNTVYAATENGLWKYVSNASVPIRKVLPTPALRKETTALYSIDGKKVSVNSKTRLYNGVYVMVQGDKFIKHQVIVSEMYR